MYLFEVEFAVIKCLDFVSARDTRRNFFGKVALNFFEKLLVPVEVVDSFGKLFFFVFSKVVFKYEVDVSVTAETRTSDAVTSFECVDVCCCVALSLDFNDGSALIVEIVDVKIE